MVVELKLLVSMGIKPHADPNEPLRPVLREVDVQRGRIVREFTYEVDLEHTPGPTSHQEFTAAAFDGEGRLLQPAHTELLWIDPRTLRLLRRVSHPLFHGVHSAAPTPRGDIVVSCAGTESVLEISTRGELVRHHWLRGLGFDAAYPGISDFRTLDHDALKPHSHHPNHACFVGDELFVTCFETSDCTSFPSRRRIALPEAIPHDGRLRQGWLWFTQVTGRIIAVDPITLQRRFEIDINELEERHGAENGMLGWCRGIEVVGSRLFVGLTMLRKTRHREVLRQLLRGAAGRKRPTRIVEIDLDRQQIVGEIPVGNAAGGTIYSILAAPRSG